MIKIRYKFAESRGSAKAAILAGAMLLALAITGGGFAVGALTTTNTIGVATQSSDFAKVTVNNTAPASWTAWGMFKGATSANGTLFDIDTATTNYTGDLTVDVYLANADQLVKVYRTLAMKIEVVNGANVTQDVGGGEMYQLLTMDNAHVTLYISTAANAYTVRLGSGFFVTNIHGNSWKANYEDPQLFIQVSQR